MEVIVLDSEAFEQIKLELKSYVKQALKEFMQEKQMTESSDWIPIEEARKLLPYKSKTTWQNLRDTGIKFVVNYRKHHRACPTAIKRVMDSL